MNKRLPGLRLIFCLALLLALPSVAQIYPSKPIRMIVGFAPGGRTGSRRGGWFWGGDGARPPGLWHVGLRPLIAAIIAAALLHALPSVAQIYPSKPIRMIVGFAPGGGTDVTARAIAQPLSDALRQRVIIDNRPGADGVVGTDIAAKSPADGYTLLMVNSGHTVNPGMYKKLPYDTVRDFAPITLVATIANLLVVHPSLPAKSVPEFVRLAKARPGTINYASGGYGSSAHLAVELFKRTAHIELVHVPYKSGGLVATALLAGEVEVSFNTIPSLISYVKAGRLRALGVSTLRRSLSVPLVPTIAEMGYPGFSASGLAGLVAPAGTPPAAIARIQKEVARLVKQHDLIERFVALGIDPVGNTPAEFDSFIRTDIDKWTQLIKDLKIHLQ